MEELHEELDEGGVSRRDALKKMAVTAAGFWAVPVISSFRSPAFAQVTSPPCTHDDAAGNCFGQLPCGAGCACSRTVSGENFCHQPSSCGALDVCTTDADCDPGFACAFSCCAELRCLPPCGVIVGAGARVAGEAWTTQA